MNFDGVGFDNTQSVTKLAEKGVPEIPVGKENYAFSVGQTVLHSGLGRYKRGTVCIIAERWQQHGYCYYRDYKGLVNRQIDLMAQV